MELANWILDRPSCRGPAGSQKVRADPNPFRFDVEGGKVELHSGFLESEFLSVPSRVASCAQGSVFED